MGKSKLSVGKKSPNFHLKLLRMKGTGSKETSSGENKLQLWGRRSKVTTTLVRIQNTQALAPFSTRHILLSDFPRGQAGQGAATLTVGFTFVLVPGFMRFFA